MAAFVASGVELTHLYRRSPFCRSKFSACWFAIALLDAAAGALVVGILAAVHLPKHAAWMASVVGWVVIGFSAALLVRANLMAVPVGVASIPVGPGIVYGTLRSVLEGPLRGHNWALNDAEADGRAKWILDRVDEHRSSLSMEEAVKKVRSYVRLVARPAGGADPMTELDAEIEAARANCDETDQIKQLVTFMSTKQYMYPLHRLVGKPSRAQVKAWRRRADSP